MYHAFQLHPASRGQSARACRLISPCLSTFSSSVLPTYVLFPPRRTPTVFLALPGPLVPLPAVCIPPQAVSSFYQSGKNLNHASARGARAMKRGILIPLPARKNSLTFPSSPMPGFLAIFLDGEGKME